MPEAERAVVLSIVGSGTLVPHGTRGSAAHHVDAGAASVLLDCGSGTLHGLAACDLDWERLTHVAISHFHYDHLGDLPALLIALKYGTGAPRETPLTLVGPRGFPDHLHGLADALGIRFLEQSFPVELVELEPGRELVDRSGSVTLRCFPTRHSDESVAFAVDTDQGTLGYTGDTGPSADLASFLAGSRVLVAECSHPDPPPTDLHLTPRGLAEMAATAQPDLLVVTHVYPSQSPAEAVAAIASRYDGRTIAGHDGLVVRIREAVIAVDLPQGHR